MCGSEQAPALESAEIVELAGALSRVQVWINEERNASFGHQFDYDPFAAQVHRVFESRRMIHVAMQKPTSILPIKSWQWEIDPLSAGLEQQARDAYAELQGRGFEVLNPWELVFSYGEGDKGVVEFTIGLGEEVANFVEPDMGALIGGAAETQVGYPSADFHPTRVRLYPYWNLLPDEEDGGLLNHLEQIGHECIVVIPSMDRMNDTDGTSKACGYAMYQISQVEGETVVKKLSVDTPLTRKDNLTLQEF